MDLGIAGRVALVTGASKGIGLGIAEALVAEGVRVAVSSRSDVRIKAAAESIDAHPFVHDNMVIDDVPHLVEAVEREVGPIDILVANTGGPPVGATPLSFTREQWESAYRELMLAPLRLISAVAPGMQERGFGRIIAVAATGVREPVPPLALSTAHKSGLLTAFKSLARQVAPDGVTVNSILPGLVGTQRLIDLFGSLEAADQAVADQVPVRRLGKVEEIASTAAFLCSQRASYITGTAVIVDGGLTHGV
jgi:3-oxoacyl-[acyl-carrier protein] reductase